MGGMLAVEHQFYLEHHEKFLREYLGKYVVIKGKALISVHDSEYEAVNETLKSHELGSFLVRQVVTAPKVIKLRARV